MIEKLTRKYWYRLRSIWTMLVGFEQPMQTVAIFTGRAAPGNTSITLRDSGLQFEARGAMDVWCLKETLLDRVYERYGFAIAPRWTVLDIGAGLGDFTVFASNAVGNGRVLAFEPFPQSFALLQVNVERNGGSDTDLFEMAVTGRPRSLELDTSSGEPLMFESVDAPVETLGSGSEIDSATLMEIVERHALKRIDLLKLDCEGAEYDILLNSPAHVIDRIARIVMEYHDGPTRHTHSELVEVLERAGFRVETFPNPVHPARIGYLRASRQTPGE